VTLFAKVEIDLATGEATLITSETILGPQNPTNINPSAGFASIDKLSAGPVDLYRFHLQDPYVRLLQVGCVEVGGGPAIVDVPPQVAGEFVNDQNDPRIAIKISQSPITGGSGTKVVLFQMSFANSTAL